MPVMNFALSVAVVALLGFAVQRGNTCAVAAVDVAMRRRDFKILWSIFDVVICVAALYGLLHLTGVISLAPSHSELAWGSLFGGILLGLGACVNGACAIGSLARLGSGDPSFFATPAGMFVGCMVVIRGVPSWQPHVSATAGPADRLSLEVLLCGVVYGLYRLFRAVPTMKSGRWKHHVLRQPWNPRTANVVIGLCFLVLAVITGPWCYTDFLYRVAKAETMDAPFLAVLTFVLFAGAIAGGVAMGKWHFTRFTAPTALRCLAGGFIMGLGLCLVPGANDGLTIEQVPLLIPSAIVAMISLFATVAAVVRWGHRNDIVVSASHRDELRRQAVAA